VIRSCSTHGEMTNVYKILVGKPEGERPIGRRGWDDNIRMDLTETVWEVVEWTHLTRWRAVMNTALNIWVP
jgi:hypothetical protein